MDEWMDVGDHSKDILQDFFPLDIRNAFRVFTLTYVIIFRKNLHCVWYNSFSYLQCLCFKLCTYTASRDSVGGLDMTPH